MAEGEDSGWGSGASRGARVKYVLLTLLVAGLVLVAGAAAFVWSGAYDIAALRQHSQPVLALLDTVSDRSVSVRADDIVPPAVRGDDELVAGFDAYAESCQQCHGAPGVPPADQALAMNPVPTNLAQAARLREPEELYWVTRYGLKMTGMPAWEFQYDEDRLWAITRFVEALDELAPAQYAALLEDRQAGRLDEDSWEQALEAAPE